jgi:hypothetical protein
MQLPSIVAISLMALVAEVSAVPVSSTGGVNAEACHNNRKIAALSLVPKPI